MLSGERRVSGWVGAGWVNSLAEEDRAVTPRGNAAHPPGATAVIRLRACYTDCGGLPGMLLQGSVPGAQPMVLVGYVWPFGIAGVWRPHHPSQGLGDDLDWTAGGNEPGGFLLWPADESGARRAAAVSGTRH